MGGREREREERGREGGREGEGERESKTHVLSLVLCACVINRPHGVRDVPQGSTPMS